MDKDGICFFVVNNSFITKDEVERNSGEHILCKKEPNCSKKFKDLNKENGRGYTYCCGLKDIPKELVRELALPQQEWHEYIEHYRDMEFSVQPAKKKAKKTLG